MADTHVTLTGNLTDDPELKFTPTGAPVANFRIAVTARVRDGETWRDGGSFTVTRPAGVVRVRRPLRAKVVRIVARDDGLNRSNAVVYRRR